MTEYPEIEKMRAIQEKSQAIGEFLDWLGSEEAYSDIAGPTGISLMVFQPVPKKWPKGDDGFTIPLEQFDDELWASFEPDEITRSEYRAYPPMLNIEKLLAKFFEIDLVKVEAEKREILLAARKEQDDA
ncbi:hypothetical protein LCGC14_1826900 [marine sediment metagenome]|uniref:Uncharacterized protein n=1 Tax=marine sediment metagenome TaxID=412755 RepID=A0A0F9JGR9_9ZZZZ